MNLLCLLDSSSPSLVCCNIKKESWLSFDLTSSLPLPNKEKVGKRNFVSARTYRFGLSPRGKNLKVEREDLSISTWKWGLGSKNGWMIMATTLFHNFVLYRRKFQVWCLRRQPTSLESFWLCQKLGFFS